MKKFVLLLAMIVVASGVCIGQTTAFSYQGKLGDSGAPANGNYDLQFKLWDAASGGTQQPQPVPVTLAINDRTVVNGIFTVQLDFGAAAFATAQDIWLEVGVRLGGSSGSYAILAPRKQLNSVPFAVKSQTATTAVNVSGVVSVANGGTGGSTQNFVDLNSNQTIGGNKTFTGTLIGDGSGLTNIRATFPWITLTTNVQQAVANTGYIVSNSRMAIITLPVEPLNAGDIVRVSSAGEGGWKIALNQGQTITTFNAEPLFWTQRESNRAWNGVASSADGTKLVALVFNGQIYTSTDSGVTWTPRDSSRGWRSVASSADGTKLVACGINANGSPGQIYTSTDSGVNWTPRESNRNWSSVASSADGANLVAVVGGGSNALIYTSTDSGVTWTPRENSRNWSSVTSSADGSKLVAVTNNGLIYTSTDSGVTWTPRESSRRWNSVASSDDGSKLVAVVGASNTSGQIYTSTDSGATWVPRESDRLWEGVASSADGTRLVAVASNLTGEHGQIYTSTDSGVTWIPREDSRDWRAVASSSDGRKLVAVVNNGKIFTTAGTAISTTVGTSGYLSGGYLSAIELQYVGGGRFIWLSHEGYISSF